MGRSPLAACGAVVLVGWLAACGMPVEPGGGAGLRIVAGSSLTDSAAASPIQALVVEVRDPAGAVRQGAAVRFESASLDSAHGVEAWVYVTRLTSDQFQTIVVDTTDARGRAAVSLHFGFAAGTAAVIVSLPDDSLADTATYVVRPASASRIELQPRDTALYAGASYRLAARVVDAFGNQRDDPVSYVAQTATAGVDQAGLVTASTIGRGSMVVRSGAVTDTGRVSVVPLGTIAASHVQAWAGDDLAIMVTNLDGSGFRMVTPTDWSCCDRTPAWTAGGTELLFEQGYPYEYLYRVDLSGSVRRFIPDSLPIVQQAFASPSRDGDWVYFSGQPDHQNWALWRARGDGTDAQLVGPAVTWYDVDMRPSLSPDGTKLAYMTNRTRPDALTISILDVASGTVTPLDVAAEGVRWSPTDADVLAYVHNDAIVVMRSDGSAQRQVSSPDVRYDPVFDWSPDGAWIVARAHSLGMLQLINLTSGLTLPLPFSTQLEQPAWRP
jgi:hypothetical protein